jgi:hypothetical protein
MRSGDTAGIGSAGAIDVQGGSSVGSTGGSVSMASGEGDAVGGGVALSGGASTSGSGGNVVLEAGVGSVSTGTVSVLDGSQAERVSVSADGTFEASTASGRDLRTVSGSDVILDAAPGSETQLGQDGSYGVRVAQDGLVSLATAQIASVVRPGDARISEDVESVDVDDMLQRLQNVPVRSLQYTNEWKEASGASSDRVRGLIGQELVASFPEYVETAATMAIAERDFEMAGFSQVNQADLVVDLVAALQGQHKRLTITPSDVNGQSSSINVDTAAGASTGNIRVGTGAADGGASGSVAVTTGDAVGGRSGTIDVAAGTSDSGSGAAIRINAGVSGSETGGSVQLGSGASAATSSGAVSMATAAATTTALGASGSTGSIQVSSGSATKASSGSVAMASGDSSDGPAGAVAIASGHSGSGQGGEATLQSGASGNGQGGDVSIGTGSGSTRSGDATVVSASGVSSGQVSIGSGSSSEGSPGPL